MTEPTDAYSRMLHEALVHLGERQERWKMSDQTPSCLGILWGFYDPLFYVIIIHHHDPHQPTNLLISTPRFRQVGHFGCRCTTDWSFNVAELEKIRGIWGRLTLEPTWSHRNIWSFFKKKTGTAAVPVGFYLIRFDHFESLGVYDLSASFWQSILILVIVVDSTDLSVLPGLLFCFFSHHRNRTIGWLVGWLVGQLVDFRPWRLETFQSRHPRIQAFLPSMSMWRRCPVDQTQHVLRKDQQAGAFGCFQK